jgi:hypothetical protein
MEFIDRITSEAKGKLCKCQGGELVKFADPISDWQSAHEKLVTWANRASHGGSLYRNEVDSLIETCEKALEYFNCAQCGAPVWFAGQTGKQRLQCSCGELVWKID